MSLELILLGILAIIHQLLSSSVADFGRIPFADDFALLADPDQAVALNNARMDLQVRSCIKFIPRKYEQDFVFFTDLGPKVECWNMFERTKGRIPVNAGPSCLEPMRRPHRPRRVFSECDIEYVNHLYHCPRRRKASPICPPGQNILSRGLPTTTTTTTSSTTTTFTIPTTLTEVFEAMTQSTSASTIEEELTTRQEEKSSISSSIAEKILTTASTTTPATTTTTATTTTPPPTTTTKEEPSTSSTTIEPTTIAVTITTTEEPSIITTPMTTTKEPSTTTTEEEASQPVTSSTAILETQQTTEATPPPMTTTINSRTTTTMLMMTLMTTLTHSITAPEWTKSIEETLENNVANNNVIIDGTDMGGGNEEEMMVINDKTSNGEKKNSEDRVELDEDGDGDVAVVIDYSGKGIKASRNDGSGSMSISKTKVTTTIEKSKYIGPCGSACSYSGELMELYRSYNDKLDITDHFYTTDRLEHHIMASQGYVMQPHMGYIGRNHLDPQCSCLKPLYRLYNDFMKDHLLTSTEHEKEVAEKILGYKFERILGYCTKEPGCGAYLPLYRFYNAIAKDHLYTVDQQEMQYYKSHPEHAYGFEKIECYVWRNNSTKDCPAATLLTDNDRNYRLLDAEEFRRLARS